MRIENALHEVRNSRPWEQRDAGVKRRRGSQRSGDVVEISPAARNLGTQTVSSADLASVKDVRQARVEEVRRRVESGFYDRPEVRRAVAEAVLPVPDDSVSPAPRSKIRARIRERERTLTISKLIRFGNIG